MNDSFADSAPGGREHVSLGGHKFRDSADVWTLSKNVKVNVGKVKKLLEIKAHDGFIGTMIHYATTKSAAHTTNMNSRMLSLLQSTGADRINAAMLINYRASLSKQSEHHLGALRGFLISWYELGYADVPESVVDLLEAWTLRGNIKGDAVKRRDPNQGPLTENELAALNEGAVRAFEEQRVSLDELAKSLLSSHTGRRPVQLSHLKNCDLVSGRTNLKGEPLYIISIPRAKQRDGAFRGSFKAFYTTVELWTVLKAQESRSTKAVEEALGYSLQKDDRGMLPLFPDLRMIDSGLQLDELRALCETDKLHATSASVTAALRAVVEAGQIYSERTGQLLTIGARRLRYTKGSRAAREGVGVVIIAELLDHSTTENAQVYIEDTPEEVAALDSAVGKLLAPYARAFQGVVVDKEGDAVRGDDPTSRVRHKGEGAGTCGTLSQCGANVPIPCYTCARFQPWLDGPHQAVYDYLHEERNRILSITGDVKVAAVNDRTILAVADVIQRCKRRREEQALEQAEGIK